MADWHDVGPEGLVSEGEVASVIAGGKPVALVLDKGSYFALYDLCTHGEALLSEGWVEDGCIECPLHQGKFCLKTGEAMSPPVYEPVAAYEVRVKGGRIEIFA